MAQLVSAFAAKPDNPSSDPATYMVQGQSCFLQVVLDFHITHTHTHVHTPHRRTTLRHATHTHVHTPQIHTTLRHTTHTYHSQTHHTNIYHTQTYHTHHHHTQIYHTHHTQTTCNLKTKNEISHVLETLRGSVCT